MDNWNDAYHVPVMAKEILEYLVLKPEGTYVDVTFGGGGHSSAILSQLSEKGRLFAFDQDDDAAQNVWDDQRLVFCKSNFRYVDRFLAYYGIAQVDGIFADLGVSSHQIDEYARGFSFNANEKLDMRMNPAAELSAYHVVMESSEEELADVFWKYGELKSSRKLAAAISRSRRIKNIETIPDLVSILEPFSGIKRNKFFAQVFQAIRIKVNDEMGALQDFLKTTTHLLAPKGRLAVLSYHSLEDRFVKRFMRTGNVEGKLHKDAYGKSLSPFCRIGDNVILPTAEEVQRNSRARSAKLRVVEKLDANGRSD